MNKSLAADRDIYMSIVDILSQQERQYLEAIKHVAMLATNNGGCGRLHQALAHFKKKILPVRSSNLC
jgi:hypothetical protein